MNARAIKRYDCNSMRAGGEIKLCIQASPTELRILHPVDPDLHLRDRLRVRAPRN